MFQETIIANYQKAVCELLNSLSDLELKLLFDFALFDLHEHMNHCAPCDERMTGLLREEALNMVSSPGDPAATAQAIMEKIDRYLPKLLEASWRIRVIRGRRHQEVMAPRSV